MTGASTIAPGDIVRLRAQRWRVVARQDHPAETLLLVRGLDAGNRDQCATFIVSCERAQPVPRASGVAVVRIAKWRRIVRQELAGFQPVDALRTAAEADLQINPYQLEPALAVVRGAASRLLIADDVGLGKTIQAALVIAEVLARVPDGRAIVVCPAGLREQWCHELQRFRLDVATMDASTVAQASWAAYGVNPWTTAAVVVTSIDYVKRPEVLRALEAIVWDVLVLDEVHALAGASERARAAAAIASRARTVVMLSATPHSGDAAAFSRLCGLGRLQSAQPPLLFRRNRVAVGLVSNRRTLWLHVTPTGAERRLHDSLLEYARLVWREHGASSSNGARLAMTVLLKRACSSASSLARSLERRLRLLLPVSAASEAQLALPLGNRDDEEDSEPLLELAAPGLSDVESEKRHVERLIELAWRAAQNESKVRVLRRLLRRVQESVLVFTEYRDTLVHLAACLHEPDVLQLHGALTPRERQARLTAFNRGERRILLATDAVSEGLNLHHHCRLVVTAELPWTPLRLEQRVGRVDRIGQQRRVHAIHLVAGGTAEESTVERLQSRAAAAESVLGGSARDENVARAVLLGPPSRHAEVPDAMSAGGDLRTIDLRAAAVSEAERIALWRVLPTGTFTRRDYRPVLSAGQPTHGAPPRCYWLFRGSIVDSSGNHLWSVPMAISADVRRRRARKPAQIRELLNPDRPEVQQAALDAHAAALASLTVAIHPWLLLALTREQEIADALTVRRSDLGPVQGGLYDRRADREAQSQSAVLEDALLRCRDRMGHLAQLRVPARGVHALAFAVTLE